MFQFLIRYYKFSPKDVEKEIEEAFQFLIRYYKWDDAG